MQFTRELSKDNIDPVELEEFKGEETAHPREIITIRRANNKPHPYYVRSVIAILDRGNGCDPETRQPFSQLTIQRARLYQDCLTFFPNYTMENLDVKNIYIRWRSTYNTNISLMSNELTRLEARCFLQASDLIDIFNNFDGSGSMMNREKAEQVLTTVGDWLLRPSSVIDTEYDKAYVLSRYTTEGCRHYLIIHRIGEGFYYNVNGIDRGMLASSPITRYAKAYPTIINLLEDVVDI